LNDNECPKQIFAFEAEKMAFMREREASRFIEIFVMDKDDGSDVNGRSAAVDIRRKFMFRKILYQKLPSLLELLFDNILDLQQRCRALSGETVMLGRVECNDICIRSTSRIMRLRAHLQAIPFA
jgi:hypothetical protein